MEYYEDLNQDLIKENMSAEGIAEQPRIKDNTMAEGEAEQPRIKEEVMAEGIPEQPRFEGNTMTVGIPYRPRIKVEDPPDNLFDFSSVPTGPKADRVDKDHVHPSRRRGLRLHGQEPEKVTKKRAKGQKAQPIGKQKQRQRGQKQKKASAGQGQAKDAAGARIGPNGRVKKPRGKKTGNKKGEAKELNRAEILEKSVAGQRIKTESSNDLDAVKPKARPVRQNANFTPLGPRRKELNTLRGIGAAQLAEIARSDSGDKDMDEMEGVEAQPWFLFGFPGEEPKAPQEKVKVDYELPKDNTRAPWDTDVLRRAFGEIE
jgi:hypothetical protein